MLPTHRAVAIACLLLASACGDDTSPVTDASTHDASTVDGPTAPRADARTGPDAQVATARCESPTSGTDLDLKLVASGLRRPVLATAPRGDERVFILEQPGRIRIVKNGTLLATPFLAIEDIVRDGGDEQGLLGLAFHPNFSSNGTFFVNYTASSPRGATVVAKYQSTAGADTADTEETRLLTIAQPNTNHNGGMLAFSPIDGFLYVGMGDGGGAGDTLGHGQDSSTLLGSMLRIDVDKGSPYAVPTSNPFVDGGGQAEIWATGLRNPWRFSFDRSNGDMWIADVGQGQREEVSVEPAGDSGGNNYGWNIVEGSACYRASSCDRSDKVDPITDFGHTGGRCSITGGFVYRGSCLPDIQGYYFYGDYCSNEIFSTQLTDGRATNELDQTSNLNATSIISGLSAFGQDGFGELYVMSLHDGKVYRIVGAGQ